MPHNIPPEIAILPAKFQRMFLLCPEYVPRKKLAELANLSPKTLANRDSNRTGPTQKGFLFNKVVYPRLEAVLWLYQHYRDEPPSRKSSGAKR